MAGVMVKNDELMNGVTSVATNTKANTALGIAIGAGVLAASNGTGGLLGNIFGGGNNDVCLVTKDQYYQERIQDIQANNATTNMLKDSICNLAQRVSVNETANAYEDRIVQMGFANVDNRFVFENILNEKNLSLAVCEATKNVIRGDLFLNPARLGAGYIAPTQVLDSHTAREYGTARYGFDAGCGGFTC